jgi:hypothetical protein
MTRVGPSKQVGPDHWSGRRDNARAYHQAARNALDLAEKGSNANPAMSSIGTGCNRIRRRSSSMKPLRIRAGTASGPQGPLGKAGRAPEADLDARLRKNAKR